MRIKTGKGWLKVKRGKVIAPSADIKARTIAGDSLMSTLIKTKVDKRSFNSYGTELKRRRKHTRNPYYDSTQAIRKEYLPKRF